MMNLDCHPELVQLLRDLSVKTGEFKLKSGRVSDFYVDARQTTLNAKGALLVGGAMAHRVRLDVVGVGGLTIGADPIVSATVVMRALSPDPNVHGFLIRKEPKSHGIDGLVVGLGNLPTGSKVAIVEDVTTTGGSLLRAVEAALQARLDVVQTITLVDREEGAAVAIRGAGFELEAITTRSELLAQPSG